MCAQALAARPNLESHYYRHPSRPEGTPLLWACTAASLDVMRALVDAGADVNAVQADGSRPLFAVLACQGPRAKDATPHLQELLDQPRLDLGVTYQGMTPVQWAVHKGRGHLVGVLEREVRVLSRR